MSFTVLLLLLVGRITCSIITDTLSSYSDTTQHVAHYIVNILQLSRQSSWFNVGLMSVTRHCPTTIHGKHKAEYIYMLVQFCRWFSIAVYRMQWINIGSPSNMLALLTGVCRNTNKRHVWQLLWHCGPKDVVIYTLCSSCIMNTAYSWFLSILKLVINYFQFE